MFTVLSEGINFDIKKSYADTVKEHITFEITSLEESIERYTDMIAKTKLQLEEYQKNRQNISVFKTTQLQNITEQIKSVDISRKAILKRIQSIEKLAVKFKKLNYPGLTDYGKDTCNILFEEEVKDLEKYLNHYNRNYETYCRDKSIIEHFGEDELGSNLSNIIAVERSRLKDYEKTLAANVKRSAELKIIQSLFKKKKGLIGF